MSLMLLSRFDAPFLLAPCIYFVFGILYIHFVFCRFVFNTNGAFIYIISFYVNKNFV